MGDTYGPDPHELERQRRQYAANRDVEIENALSSRSGSVSDILGELGITNQKGSGQAKYQQFTNFTPQYGKGANVQNTYDWKGGMKYDPLYGTEGTDDAGNPTYTRGKWIPITKEEWDGYNEMQGYNEKYGEGNFNPWRMERMKYDLNSGYGHLEKDDQGRYYHDDGKTRTYFDDRYQPIGSEPSPGDSGTSTEGEGSGSGSGGTGESEGDGGVVALEGGPNTISDEDLLARYLKEQSDKALDNEALKGNGAGTAKPPTISPTAPVAPARPMNNQTIPWFGSEIANADALGSSGPNKSAVPSHINAANPLTTNGTTPLQREVSSNFSDPSKPKASLMSPKKRVPGFSLL